MPIIPDSFILESTVSRNVVTSGDLESTTKRSVLIEVELESTVSRRVSGADAHEDPEAEKEYHSFLKESALNKMQFDVLNQDLTKNPYFDNFLDDLENSALRTRNKTIVKAINELVTEQKKNFTAVVNNMKKFNDVIGDLAIDPALREAYTKLGAKNVFTAAVNLNKAIDKITEFVQGNASDIEAWNEMGYQSILSNLNDVSPAVRRISSLIANLTDEQLANIFSEEAADFGEAIRELNEKLDNLDTSIHETLTNLENDLREEITNSHDDIITKIGKWGTLTEAELTVILEELGVEKTASSDGVQALHTLADKCVGVINAMDVLESDIANINLSLDAWGRITEDKAEELLQALGANKDNPTGLKVLESLVDSIGDSNSAIDSVLIRLTNLELSDEGDAAAIARLRREFEEFKDYINNRFATFTQEVTDLLGAWGTLTAEEATTMLESLGAVDVTDPTGKKVLSSLVTKYLELKDYIDNLDIEEKVNQIVDPKLQQLADSIAETFNTYKEEVNEQLAHILSLFEDNYEDTGLYKALQSEIESASEQLNNRVTTIEMVLDAIEASNLQLKTDLQSLQQLVAENKQYVDEQFEAVDTQLDELDDRIRSLEEDHEIDVSELDNRVTNLELLADQTLTVNDIATEQDIRNMF
jgi:predicted  nucleic acid-binding Zn-ribbon protein